MEIGERVKTLRKSTGMTQEDLADAIDMVNQVYISRLETGRLKNVKPDIAKALSEALDVPVEYILFGEEPVRGPSPSGGQPVQRFLTNFFSLDPPQQAQVMEFTAFINRGEKAALGGGEESS